MILRKSWIFAVLGLAVAAGSATWIFSRPHGTGSEKYAEGQHEHHAAETATHGPKVVTYRGENYVLLADGGDYTDEQAAKIENIILTDKAPSRAPVYQNLIDYLNTVEAPGYGSSTGGFGDPTSLGQITYISVQLPKKSEFRVMTYRASQPNADYLIVDDFMIKCVYPPALELAAEGDDLIYRDEKNQHVLRKINLRERIPKE